MARIFTVNDPFNPRNKLGEYSVEPGTTIGDWVNKQSIDYRSEPFVFMLVSEKGQFFPLREEWDRAQILEDETLWVIPYVGDAFSIVFAIIAAVASVVISLMIKPAKLGSQEAPDPVYGLSGQKNQNRLNNPIEDAYGRNRLWGSYAAAPYTGYFGNNQFLYQLFCLGQGEYDIETIQIEDTPIDNFQEIEYEVIPPGGQVSLFPDNVISSTEVDDIELKAPNQPDYPTDGWFGPFVASDAGTDTNRLEVDLVFPNGLYNIDTKGSDQGDQTPMPVEYEFQYQQIDDSGNPMGNWEVLYYESRTYNTNQTLRQTFFVENLSGRFHVRARRLDDKSTDAADAHVLKWQGLRAFLPSTRTYGDVTLLAVKARATNNLSNNAASKINVVATRMIPTYSAGTWSGNVATRNPVWAFCQILRADYGGQLPDKNIDLDFLEQEAALADARGESFDWIFERKITLWEALKAAAGAMRAVPMLNGSVVSIIRDQLRSDPVMLFGSENIHSRTFRLEKKLNAQDTEDGLVVEYTDQSTWRTETVNCFLDGELGISPKRLVLRGVTDRDKAYQFGMYQRAVEKYERTQVKFTTGLEGALSTFGDLVKVASDIPRWGQSGAISEFVVSGSQTLGVRTVEPLEFTSGANHTMAIRGRTGAPTEYAVIKGEDEFTAYFQPFLTSPLDIPIGGDHEPPLYAFGTLDQDGELCRVVGITPNGEDSVNIVAVLDDSRRFAFDGVSAPPLDSPNLPTTPDLPVVTGLTVKINEAIEGQFQVNWSPAPGAQYYTVEWSSDGSIWLPLGNTTETSMIHPFTVSTLDAAWFRVAGVNAAAGPWATWFGILKLQYTLSDDEARDIVDDDGRILGIASD